MQGVNWNLNPTFGTPANRFAYEPAGVQVQLRRQVLISENSQLPNPTPNAVGIGVGGWEFSLPYSYRSAAIGSSAAAFRAG